MLSIERRSLPTRSKTHFASARGTREASVQHTPRENQLLAALPLEDYERLLADLEPVALPRGWTVHRAGDRERYLYFLTEGIVSLFYVTRSGATLDFAVTGNEGVSGVASFLGDGNTPCQAMVLSAGHAYRLEAGLLKSEFEHHGPLPRLLLRYTQALIVQVGQIAVCNRHHSVKQRLCRWILSCLDRSPSSALTVTHELIGKMLGVRREGVTEALGILQQARLVHSTRGRIAVLDRHRLEGEACECYAVVKQECDRLTPGHLHPAVAS